MKGIVVSLCLGGLSLAPALHADITLPAIFSDHMVVQSGKPVAFWGRADAGERITVTLAGNSAQTTTGADGKWSVKLGPLGTTASAQTLTVKGRNTLTVSDVLIGEVWLCAGQSNMAMEMEGLHGQVDNADAEIAAANHPTIRMFAYYEYYSIYTLLEPPATPLADRPGKWIVCTPATAAKFIALGYYFATGLQRQVDAPVGLIATAVGGTPIEAWTSLPAQQAKPAVQPVLADWKKRLHHYDAAKEQQTANEAKAAWQQARATATKAGQPIPKAPAAFKNLLVSNPAGLFNGMIAPVIPYGVRGVLWYQGERNAAGPFTHFYGVQLETLIADWRAHWGEELYFAWVQIPRFQKEQTQPMEPKGWGVSVRDEQRRTLKVPHTAMAITIDYGGVTDGHPTNKKDYAERLLLLPLHDVYGKNLAEWTGPLYRSMEKRGRELVLSFDHAAELRPKDGGELKGFAIAGADQKFVWAKTRIEGDQVIVWSDELAEPAAVRYAWASNPKVNLVNSAGLPASPFRTDDWPAP
ncbi:sialate O-acetylesterase [Oleiharenicola lentus]|uniref:sialate O-acetylesterase n=1 Tax=Oleiharenicola lentus TaxID=2508720 RepID=UPI003F66F6BE